jgi:hypothetical protein
MMRAAVILGAILGWSTLAFAQGGPPLVTDDPGTPSAGQWEINVAGRWLATRELRIITVPYLDINYGWGERVQLKLETGWATEEENHHAPASGLINYLAGTKIRFLDEETAGVAVSTYPQVEFRGPIASKDERINEDGSHVLVPLEISKTFDAFGVNPEFGVDGNSRGDTTYFYGVAFAYEIEKDKEVLWEVHGRSAVHTDDREWFYNIGTRWLLDKDRSLILSAGHSWQTFRKDDAFLLVYLGTQFRF